MLILNVWERERERRTTEKKETKLWIIVDEKKTKNKIMDMHGEVRWTAKA